MQNPLLQDSPCLMGVNFDSQQSGKSLERCTSSQFSLFLIVTFHSGDIQRVIRGRKYSVVYSRRNIPRFPRLLERLISKRRGADPAGGILRHRMRARYRGARIGMQRRTRLVMELTAAITFVATSSLLRRPNESSRQQPTRAVEVCARFHNSFSTYLRSSSRGS